MLLRATRSDGADHPDAALKSLLHSLLASDSTGRVFGVSFPSESWSAIFVMVVARSRESVGADVLRSAQ